MERPLIVDPEAASAGRLDVMLHEIWPCQAWTAANAFQGMRLAGAIDPKLIFVEHVPGVLDGMAFTQTLRRSDLACRKAPVIMISAEATPEIILGARDAGVYTFLSKPYGMKDLVRRLGAIALQPRGWIEAVGYVGPDRRRFTSSDSPAPRRRRSGDSPSSPERDRLIQALKIVASAVDQIDSDPGQVRRALNAQAIDLRRAAVASGDPELEVAARRLQVYLGQVAAGTALSREGLEPFTSRLLAFLPKDETAREAA